MRVSRGHSPGCPGGKRWIDTEQTSPTSVTRWRSSTSRIPLPTVNSRRSRHPWRRAGSYAESTRGLRRRLGRNSTDWWSAPRNWVAVAWSGSSSRTTARFAPRWRSSWRMPRWRPSRRRSTEPAAICCLRRPVTGGPWSKCSVGFESTSASRRATISSPRCS